MRDALLPMLVSTYVALLGFVITASTILITMVDKNSHLRTMGMQRVSKLGYMVEVFEAFGVVQKALLTGAFLGLLGFIIDKPFVPKFLVFIYFAVLGWNLLLIMNGIHTVTTLLDEFGKEAMRGDSQDN
jgi:hypothetical protein